MIMDTIHLTINLVMLGILVFICFNLNKSAKPKPWADSPEISTSNVKNPPTIAKAFGKNAKNPVKINDDLKAYKLEQEELRKKW